MEKFYTPLIKCPDCNENHDAISIYQGKSYLYVSTDKQFVYGEEDEVVKWETLLNIHPDYIISLMEELMEFNYIVIECFNL